MSQHSQNKLWIHFIWETHNREKVLTREARKIVSKILFDYSKEKKIFMKVNYVNADHVHTLIDLPTSLSVEECVKLLKGYSSYIINKDRIVNSRFSWGKGYGAFSVSTSKLDSVVNYIKGQEDHHRVKSFTEEYELFIKEYKAGISV